MGGGFPSKRLPYQAEQGMKTSQRKTKPHRPAKTPPAAKIFGGGACSLILQAVVFETDLGAISLLWNMDGLRRLTLGHDSPEEALEAILPAGRSFPEVEIVARPRGALGSVVDRLKRYAETGAEDFVDVPIAQHPVTAFQSAVIAACRRIPPGQTRTYAELAEIAGAPRAARAVGNCMRTNRIPLVIPCHRVVAAGGKLGGYSAAHGLSLKRRLLALEGIAGYG
jgi:methylated-DNA-[protein]-cysteine S-methyltransferase